MKLKLFFAIFTSSLLLTQAFSQTNAPAVLSTSARNRAIQTNPAPTPVPLVKPNPAPGTKVIITGNLPAPTPRPTVIPTPNSSVTQQPYNPMAIAAPTPLPPPTFYKPLSFNQIKNKIAEARRQMNSRPVQTALTNDSWTNNIIRIAFYDYETGKVDYLVTSKTSFLSADARIATTTTNNKFVTLRILRPNFVNTAVMIVDANNRAHLPLIVQYPVEKNGKFIEMANYISTHAGIVTPEVVSAGKFYVRNVIDTARENLKKKNIFIAPQVTDVAERLSIVEHVDHQRFFNESQPQIYNEVYALFALNEGQTYRYSVSSAGAGGMVQMIPWTYDMIRSRHYTVGLIPDFVEGMRNHQNAAQAMLLYMQMTWLDLNANETIYNALQSGIATPAELMSAGYNSNPAKLAGYIRRAGANWKTLIPRETKVYLQIYDSMDKYVPVLPRTK